MKRLIAIVLCVMIALTIGKDAEAKSKKKTVKEYIGKWYVSTYKPSDSSQNGHRTSSGRRAKSGRTVAVDLRNPKAKMNTWVHIKGFGKLRVEDYGGFGRFNGGRRAFDVFREDHEKGGLWLKKCWVYRKETQKEYKARLKKEAEERAKQEATERMKRQKGEFILKYDPSIKKANQVITDPKYIKGGCICFGGGWLEVIKTKKNLKNVILVGDKTIKDMNIKVYLQMVEEGAVG